MDEVGKDSAPRKINRRTALATIAGSALMILDKLQRRSIVNQPENKNATLVQVAKNEQIIVQTTEPTPLPTVLATVTTTSVSERIPAISELSPSVRDIFRNCTPAELVTVSEWVKKEFENFETQENNEKCVIQTWNLKNDIDKVAATLNINREVVPWIMPLIFAESRGDATAVSQKSGAKGLCQIMPDTLTHLKQYLKLETESNLFDGKENIHLGLEYLDYLYKFIPEPSLALWSYHLGFGNMIKAIGFYYGIDTSFITADLNKYETAPAAKQKLRDLILPKNGTNLNLVKMLTSTQVINGLKKADAFHDSTQVYVPRIAAASSYFPLH